VLVLVSKIASLRVPQECMAVYGCLSSPCLPLSVGCVTEAQQEAQHEGTGEKPGGRVLVPGLAC